MLVCQAWYAAKLFLNRAVPEETMQAAYAAVRRECLNLVLTGMPGSGKTTLGKAAARMLGRQFVDLDEEIVKRHGPILDIFKNRGEAAFREMESEIIREFTKESGLVIATGGGAVLRQENLGVLKQNGTVIFLDRELSALLPTADRPLADSEEKLRALYTERRPIYLKAADVTLAVEGTPEQTADALMRCLL
mgnify:CR=1 FL=1